MAHWAKATHAAAKPECISRFTAAMAATHGEYSRVKARKLAAESGVKMPCRAVPRLEMLVPVSTAMVLTTASLAEKPVIRAVAARQSVKPSGANSGASMRPRPASILAEESATSSAACQTSAKTK